MDDPTPDVSGITRATWGNGPVRIVLLHDGLGSIAQWGDVPRRIAEQTGVAVLAYDRAGHGSSTPVPSGPWPTDWLRDNARVLDQLLDRHDIERPLLVGHSDGGSIALLHAALHPGRACGVVAIAAHTYVEPICCASIREMRANAGVYNVGLGRYHSRPVELFEAWSGVWVSDDFQRWDIRDELAAITVPTVVAQGANDEYATDAMVHDTVAAIGSNARGHFIAERGHLVHYEDPEPVIELVVEHWNVVDD